MTGAVTELRAGAGTPLVLLHGLTAGWRVWTPVLDALTARHDVLALTLAGHHAGAPVDAGSPVSVATLATAVERRLDELGLDRVHLAGSSLGGWLTLELARRGRALSAVALSPAGAWGTPRHLRRAARLIRTGHRIAGSSGPRMNLLLARPRTRRLLLRGALEHGDRVSATDAIAMLADNRNCTIVEALLASLETDGPISPGPMGDIPVRIVWGGRDRTIPFKHYGRPLLEACQGAELVELPGAGHVPMWDAPAEVSRLILETTARGDAATAINTNQGGTTMAGERTTSIEGSTGELVLSEWAAPEPRLLIALAHGYGEHAGRYAHVAERLVADADAVVVAPDHAGHGQSAGERAVVADIDDLASDFERVVNAAREEHPDLPLVVVGHSMGALIATRYAQEHRDELAALVVSGPPIGGNPDIFGLLDLDPIPPVPIDPAILSRDPAVGEAFAADPLVYDGPFQRQTLEAFVAVVDRIAAGGRLDPFPTLWLHGELDALAPLDVSRAALERVRGESFEEHVYPGAMHEVFNETNQDEVIGDMLAFISRHVTAARV